MNWLDTDWRRDRLGDVFDLREQSFAAPACTVPKNLTHQKSSFDKKKGNQTLSVHLHTHTHTHTEEDKESEIFNALANALTAPANRPLKEMSSQLPEVCPFD